jgi:simple sugar transport system permease protein
MNLDLLTLVVAGAVLAAAPLALAATGELLAEDSGVMNLGVEGMMLLGAVAAFLTVLSTSNLALGVLAAMIVGGILSLVHAFFAISLRTDQVVSGLAVTLFATGLTQFLGLPFGGKAAPAVFSPAPLPVASGLPVLGPALFNQNVLTYLTFCVVVTAWFFLQRMRAGLALRSVGENPAAADAAGVDVFRVRYLAVVVGGLLAGLAGAFMSLAYVTSWSYGITAGRGWIAIAVVIFARWTPVGVAAGALLFGLAYVMTFTTQTFGGVAGLIPTYFVQMVPYLLAVFVLVLVSWRARGRSAAPGGLGKPYVRGER